jgi:hypothetical protein
MQEHVRNWIIKVFGLSLVLTGAMVFATMPPEHFVSVGGKDLLGDQNLSMLARERNGVVTGKFNDQFTAENGGEGIHANIECLHVVGNQAWIRAVVTHGRVFGEDVTGQYVYSRVKDNGTSANDPPDQVSLSFIRPNLIACSSQFNITLFDMPEGQVIVR